MRPTWALYACQSSLSLSLIWRGYIYFLCLSTLISFHLPSAPQLRHREHLQGTWNRFFTQRLFKYSAGNKRPTSQAWTRDFQCRVNDHKCFGFFYIYILQLCSPKLTQVLSKFTSIWYYQVWLSQIIPLIWNSTFAFKTHFKGVCTLTEPLQMVLSWKRPCSRNRSSKESYRANQPYSKYQLHRAVKVTAIPDANIIEEKLVRLGNMGEASSHSIKLKHILCSISF